MSSEGPGKLNVCFTPGEKCTDLMIQEIRKARHTIHVQAFSFTSSPLAEALVEAHHRGVNVHILLDKSNLKDPYSLLKAFRKASVPVSIDSVSGIAHNKVMVIDERSVITGSFNFTQAAQNRNAENVILIQDESLARHYSQNWQKRRDVSKRVGFSQK